MLPFLFSETEQSKLLSLCSNRESCHQLNSKWTLASLEHRKQAFFSTETQVTEHFLKLTCQSKLPLDQFTSTFPVMDADIPLTPLNVHELMPYTSLIAAIPKTYIPLFAHFLYSLIHIECFAFGDEERSFCRFWDCIQVLHFGLFCWPPWLLHFFWGIPACGSRYNGHLS